MSLIGILLLCEEPSGASNRNEIRFKLIFVLV